MISDTQIRDQLFRRIQRIRADKLKQLNDFAAKLEENETNKDKILSFAGAWDNIDDDLLNNFTDKLITRRKSNGKLHAGIHFLTGTEDSACHGQVVVPIQPG